jgi:hypothetical protein
MLLVDRQTEVIEFLTIFNEKAVFPNPDNLLYAKPFYENQFEPA